MTDPSPAFPDPALALQDERRRIAHELHDTAVQHLNVAVLHLSQLQERLAPRTAMQLLKVETLLRRALTDARHCLQGCLSENVACRGLDEHLRQLIAAWQPTDLRPRLLLILEGERRPVGADVEHELACIAQEALANALRHAAGAEVITLTLTSAEDGRPALTVEDDGCGFPGVPFSPTTAPGVNAGGLGLSTMRQRAARLGATLEISPAASRRGTRVALRWIVDGPVVSPGIPFAGGPAVTRPVPAV